MQRHLLIPLTILPLLAGLAAQAAPVALPPVVNTAAAAMPDLMDGLLNHKASPQDLWNSGQLNGDVLAQLLNQVPWRVPENQELANQLCGLLVEKAPDKITDPLALPSLTRRRLALYFKSIHDPRAVTFFEAILSLIKTPRATGVAEVFELSDYYNETGDWQKAVQTRLRVKDYTTAESYLANAALEAARIYMEHGETEKAQPLYERAEKSSFGWAAGVALIDHGRALMKQKKYDEAIKVFSTPITGQYADQIEPIKRMLIGDIYYAEGDLAKARENMQVAIAAYHAVKNPLSGEGLQTIFTSAEKRLQTIMQWTKEPIQVDPQEVHIAVDAKQLQNGPIIARLHVRTYRDAPLTVTTDNKNVAAQILLVNEWSELSNASSDLESETEVIIKVTSLPQKNTKVLLTINSAQYSGFQAQVPVYLEVGAA
jgi:predicted negative regulator of RcsB-dependent stress response